MKRKSPGFTEARRKLTDSGNYHIHSKAYVAREKFADALRIERDWFATLKEAQQAASDARDARKNAEVELLNELEAHFGELPRALEVYNSIYMIEVDDDGVARIEVIDAAETASVSDLLEIEPAAEVPA